MRSQECGQHLCNCIHLHDPVELPVHPNNLTPNTLRCMQGKEQSLKVINKAEGSPPLKNGLNLSILIVIVTSLSLRASDVIGVAHRSLAEALSFKITFWIIYQN